MSPRMRGADGTPVPAAPSTRMRDITTAVFAVVVGVAAGLAWRFTTPRVTYTVGEDQVARISENDMVDIFIADARYVLFALLGGLLLGMVVLTWLRRRGATLVVWALGTTVVAGLLAWGVGVVGATPMEVRVDAATPGDQIPNDLQLRSAVAVLIWPLAALVPVLVWSSFARDPDGLANTAGPRRGRRA